MLKAIIQSIPMYARTLFNSFILCLMRSIAFALGFGKLWFFLMEEFDVGGGLIVTGLRWRVDDGSSILTLKDKWIPRPFSFQF
ncbi:hypothetical protein ACOSQ2_020527 [Xanthoceras sorbifolium]